MKESKLIEMQKQLETLGAAVTRLVNEVTNLKDLSVGTLELVKRLPDYEKALWHRRVWRPDEASPQEPRPSEPSGCDAPSARSFPQRARW